MQGVSITQMNFTHLPTKHEDKEESKSNGSKLKSETLQESVEAGPSESRPVAKLPRKKFYRQRAHCNPMSDRIFEDHPKNPEHMQWEKVYPEFFENPENCDTKVEFLDVGCGYGGLLVTLSTIFPQKLMLGIEIRLKVSDYVKKRIEALKKLHLGDYTNIACIRTNAMRYLPFYFPKGQLQKMFFLYPDPHFKKRKFKWRIINYDILAEYAYIMALGGLLYIATDVKDLFDWMNRSLESHPLFKSLTESEIAQDICAQHILNSTEEGKKVERNGGEKFMNVFRRVEAKRTTWWEFVGLTEDEAKRRLPGYHSQGDN